MPRRLSLLITVIALAVGAVMPAAVAADEPGPAPKVAIIVGPVGAELTPVYLALAETAAATAEASGASVARAYSPDATPERVLEAVADANIVVYFGHGLGVPNPYSATPSSATVNGWGLTGPNPDPDHGDAVADGQLVYRGEAWIAAHARPAPGWVMIYSNACYAPGAGEGFEPPADEAVAAARVSAYSRVPLGELGASAYFATDFHAGAAHLVAALLDQPDLAYGDLFTAEPRFVPDAVTRLPHGTLDGLEVWLQRSPYFGGQVDYWYAFAGDPLGSFDRRAASAPRSEVGPLDASSGLVVGRASSYGFTRGWEGRATVALPIALGGGSPGDTPSSVLVCADRCAMLPVVDSCPCYVGTTDQRIANLSHQAWREVTDAPLEEGLVEVKVYLWPVVLPSGRPGSPPRA